MASCRGSRSKRVDSDPLGDLLENLKQNPIPGLFTSPSTDSSSVVVLDDWWLVRPNVEGGSKRVAVAGYIAEKEKEFPFTSAPIIKRHDTFTLEAADGITVKVEGMINQTNTQTSGFSHEVCQRFNIGFPFFWEKYIDSCVDSTPTHGASTQILEQFVNGARENLNCNPEVAERGIRIIDETLEPSPGSSTKEFEPRSNKNQTDDKEPNAKYTMPQSGNNFRSEELPVADIEHEDGPISTVGKESEEFATPAKVGTMSGTKLPSAGKRKNAAAELKLSDMSLSNRIGSCNKDYVPQSTVKIIGRGRSGTNMECDNELISTDGKDAEESAPEKGDTARDAKLRTTGKSQNAVEESKVSDMSLRSGKGSSKKDRVPQSTAKRTARGHSRADIERENGPISTDDKDAEVSATPEKGVTVRDANLPTTGKRKNAVAESKVSGSVKGSSKKDHVPQSTSKTTHRGHSHTNMEVHGATISPSQSESNIRRSRSGRAIIPTIDKGSQTVVYDQNGNFAGVVSPISVSKGGTSKPCKKKRRF